MKNIKLFEDFTRDRYPEFICINDITIKGVKNGYYERDINKGDIVILNNYMSDFGSTAKNFPIKSINGIDLIGISLWLSMKNLDENFKLN